MWSLTQEWHPPKKIRKVEHLEMMEIIIFKFLEILFYLSRGYHMLYIYTYIHAYCKQQELTSGCHWIDIVN